MPDRGKVIKEWEAVLNRDPLDAPWDLIDDTVTLLKEQEEREKGICKEICGFIRGPCSTDTDADKAYVCHVIQQCFINYGIPMEGR